MIVTEERTIEGSAADDPPVRRPRSLSMAALITLLYGVGGFALASRSLGDNSFLWHLRTGGLILDHGIPKRDPFSFTAAGTDWIAQSWLAELMYGALARSVGEIGIRVAVGLAGACIAVFLFRIALRTTNDRVRALAIGIPALACSFTVWSERPLMFGLVLLSALVYTVEIPESFLGRHPSVVIPVVMCLWVNVHGTFALGFAYLAVHFVGRLLDGEHLGRGRARELIIGTAIAAVLVFVNPYGPSLVLFPLALMGRSSVLSNVGEWQSVDLHTPTGYVYAFWLFLSVVALSRSRPRRSDLLMSIVFLLLGWWAIRNVAITVAVTIPIVGRAFRPAKEAAPAERNAKATPILVLLVVLVGALLIGRALARPDFDLKRYPVATMRALDSQDRLGDRLLTTDAWAGYVIERYWPRQHVFFDDRYDMYPTAMTDAYNKVLSLKPGWERVLDQYRINLIVWPKDDPVVQALKHLPGWTQIRADKVAKTFERTTPL